MSSMRDQLLAAAARVTLEDEVITALEESADVLAQYGGTIEHGSIWSHRICASIGCFGASQGALTIKDATTIAHELIQSPGCVLKATKRSDCESCGRSDDEESEEAVT